MAQISVSVIVHTKCKTKTDFALSSFLDRYPNALADAVRSNDQNFVRLLLRAPKPLRTDIISSCLPAAVQQSSHDTVSLLIAYGADPNFDSASALNMAISRKDYRLAIAVVPGPIPLTKASLQQLLNTTMGLPNHAARVQFLQLLLCCGLPSDSAGLSDLLISSARQNDTAGVHMMLSYGVSAAKHEAECLKIVISNYNWSLAYAILQTPISPQQASAALKVLPHDVPHSEKQRVIQALVQKGATGPPLSYWLTRAVEEADESLMNLLLSAGAPIVSSGNSPIHAAISKKDLHSLQMLLNTRPSPEVLAKAFPLLRIGHSPRERLIVSRLLLKYGAHGTEVDEALIYAVADGSSNRDMALITELCTSGANVNYDNGKVLQLAVSQANLALLQLFCNSKPTVTSTSAALPLVFGPGGSRHSKTLDIIDLLLANGVEERPALQALQIAIQGGSDNEDIMKRLVATNIKLLDPALEYTVASEDTKSKTTILKALLRMGVTQGALDRALAAESHHAVSNRDTTCTKMLLEMKASVAHNDGEAVRLAVASKDSALTELLLSRKHQLSQAILTKAFGTLFQSDITEEYDKVTKIAQELLRCGVDQAAIDSALYLLLANTYNSQHINDLLDLLLRYNANVNTAEGACFVFASKHNTAVLEKLLQYGPTFSVIVPALITSKLTEEAVVDALQAFFSHGYTFEVLEQVPSGSGSYKMPVLLLAMREYPRSQTLIKLLLDHGCDPEVSARGVIDPSTGEETMSTLLWALSQPQKRVSDPIIAALVSAGASVNRASQASEIAPIALASREGRSDIVRIILEWGADASVRDKWNRSALFYASSTPNVSTVQILAPHALKNDGSLHEATRSLQVDVVAILIKHGHSSSFPSRLHQGRQALSELCLNVHVTTAGQRSRLRQTIRLLIDSGADSKFKVRNEKSAILLALDNAYSSVDITEALLETEIWEELNDEKHLYRDASGLWYSPLKYVELIPSPSRAPHKQTLIELLRDKGCEPRFYSENAQQPPGAIGLPKPIRQLADRQKEHELTLKLEQERHEHARRLEEDSHHDILRRKREQEAANLLAQTTATNHHLTLEQQKHDFEIHRVRDAERMKRAEKVAWHNLITEQEHDATARRQIADSRKASATIASEAKMIEQRKGELEHRAGVEKRMLKDKEEVYERNVGRQKGLMKVADESAQLHAKLRQERPAIEGPPVWGSVD
jgi:ankyrin repeat protein